jgi:hypothetical protein
MTMRKPHEIRGKLGSDKENVPQVLTRAWLMHDMMDADLGTYGGATPSLPDFLVLIQNLVLAQQKVPTRTVGAAAARDVQRDLLVTGMHSELSFVQRLADASPGRAASLIVNAGLLLAEPTVWTKALLTLSLGVQPGSVVCDANVSLLVHAGAHRPRGQRLLNWEYTVDGGQTFVSATATPGCRTVLEGLPRLALVGVRVSLSDLGGTGAWSQLVAILVD